MLPYFLAQENYGYNHAYIIISGMNILPILSWSLGLIGVSEIFNHFRTKRRLINFMLFIPLFWILLVLIETYAFHVIEIRDTMSGNTIGLPFCNCIHAPWWMRIVYFTMGPAYYGLTILVDPLIEKYFTSTTSWNKTQEWLQQIQNNYILFLAITGIPCRKNQSVILLHCSIIFKKNYIRIIHFSKFMFLYTFLPKTAKIFNN